MIDAAVSGLRWIQYLAAVAALGLPLFGVLASGGRRSGPESRLAIAAGLVLAFAAPGGLVAQTAMMAGGWRAGLDPAALGYVIQSTSLGMAHVIRAGLAVIGVVLLLPGPGSRPGSTLAILAFAGAMASFAWSGHGAATEGSAGLLHLTADIVHLIAAAVWLGALAGFCLLLARPRPGDVEGTSRALTGFAVLGTGAVAALAITGTLNTFFLVGPDGLGRIMGSTWGVLLMVKLALFVLMLGLAAHNRFTLAPALSRALDGGAGTQVQVRHLRLSVGLEMLAGIALLGVVAVMGVQMPPASM
ncbi:MAG: copper homeostasis membrane protein CopD [Caulobacteraceae bacterium]|nr:copper homeostasis membrane protein CopD [Caulobacteraceae bacterium]